MAGLVDPIEVISVLIKAGRAIHDRYKTYRHAGVDLRKLDGHLGGSLFILETFQQFIERNLGSLLSHQQQQIIALVDQLQGVFDRLDKQMSRLPAAEAKFDFIKKIRWSFGGKSGYDAIIQEMKEWRSELNEVIIAIKLLQEGTPDASEAYDCHRRLFRLAGAGLRQAAVMEDVVIGRHEADITNGVALYNDSIISSKSILQTPYTEGDDNKIARLAVDDQVIYIEYRTCNLQPLNTTRQETASDVLKLGNILSYVDPESMHILRCIGVEYQEARNRYLLFYSIPGHCTPEAGTPMTLSQAIHDKKVPKPTLEARIQYAKEITMAVMFTHAAGLVHKAICPESILVVPSSESTHERSAFLFGYDAAGLADMPVYRHQVSQTDSIKMLYSHPDRQRHVSDTPITCGMRHDMYSLGVVLLELGMWKPFRHLNKTLQEIYGLRDEDFDIRTLRECLVEEARNNLPCETGSIYASVVICCLSRTLPQNINEREMKEIFYERVIQKLHGIIV